MHPTTHPAGNGEHAAKTELLGVCLVYLGGLNYFLPVDEPSPIVSKIGTVVGHLHLRIIPYVHLRPLHEMTKINNLMDPFVQYERRQVDAPEEQISEYMDRPLQYHVELQDVTDLTTRKFSHLSLKYRFFKEITTQTDKIEIVEGQVRLAQQRIHHVDVDDAFVKYITNSNLTIESACGGSAIVSKTFHRYTQLKQKSMSSGNRDVVDALWDELQSENNWPKKKNVARLLGKSMAGHKSCRAEKNAAKKAIKPVKTNFDRFDIITDPLSIASTSSLCVSKELSEAFNLQKELNRLSDENKNVQKQAAIRLEAHFLPPEKPLSTEDEESFAELAKPLFKRFNDPVEKVRDVCIRITTRFIAKEQDLLRYLPYLMPAICNRINSQFSYDEENQTFSRDKFLHDAFKRGRIYVEEDQVTRLKPEEPSEEIRLLFLDLIDVVLQNAFARNASSILHAYIFDILLVLVTGLHDDYHEVNIKSCTILASISNHMVSVMKHFSVAIIRIMKNLLLHRLARVRIAAIDAIRVIMSCPSVEKCKGSGTEAIVDLIGHRDENVIPVSAFYTTEVRINYFAKLDQDANVLVRKAFFAMISDWMMHLPDRYDHESRLLPYLLSAVSDENHDISQAAMKTLKFLGDRYEQEHGEEVIELKQYGVDGKNPTYNYLKRLPSPFHEKRPSLGTRLFVRGRARRFLNPILNELINWQSNTRAHAVRLLKCVIIFCEETITVDVHLILQTLLRTWGDALIQAELREIADLTGRFSSPDTYMGLILARIRGDTDVATLFSPHQTATAIEVLTLLMEGSLDKMLLPHIHDILDTICSKHIINLQHKDVRHALAGLLLHITRLLERRGQEAISAYFLQHGRLASMERMYDRIFGIAVVLKSSEDANVTAEATIAMGILMQLECQKSMEDLYEIHFRKDFQRLTNELLHMSDVQWSATCYEQLQWEELLRRTRIAVLLEPSFSELLEKIFSNILVHHQESAMNDESDNNLSLPPTSDMPVSSSIGANDKKHQLTTLMGRRNVFERTLRELLARINGISDFTIDSESQKSTVEKRLQALLSRSEDAVAA